MSVIRPSSVEVQRVALNGLHQTLRLQKSMGRTGKDRLTGVKYDSYKA